MNKVTETEGIALLKMIRDGESTLGELCKEFDVSPNDLQRLNRKLKIYEPKRRKKRGISKDQAKSAKPKSWKLKPADPKGIYEVIPRSLEGRELVDLRTTAEKQAAEIAKLESELAAKVKAEKEAAEKAALISEINENAQKIEQLRASLNGTSAKSKIS